MGRVTAKRLRELLCYDSDTGVFTWRMRRAPHVPAGCCAGSKQHNGYVKIVIDKQQNWAHRLAWLYVHGIHPNIIDHIDGDKSNNRISNLRPCTQSQNAANGKTRNTNKSGTPGVWLRPDTGKYTAFIGVNGKKRNLGCFETAAEAAAVRTAEARRVFGEFART